MCLRQNDRGILLATHLWSHLGVAYRTPDRDVLNSCFTACRRIVPDVHAPLAFNANGYTPFEARCEDAVRAFLEGTLLHLLELKIMFSSPGYCGDMSSQL